MLPRLAFSRPSCLSILYGLLYGYYTYNHTLLCLSAVQSWCLITKKQWAIITSISDKQYAFIKAIVHYKGLPHCSFPLDQEAGLRT